MSRTTFEKTLDRLFLLKLIQETPIQDYAILEKIVLVIQIILLDNNRQRIFSYRFFKSRIGNSETNLYSDLSDIRRADFIRFYTEEIQKLTITKHGKAFLDEFTVFMNEKSIENFYFAIELFKKNRLGTSDDLDNFIRESPIILAADVGRSVFA